MPRSLPPASDAPLAPPLRARLGLWVALAAAVGAALAGLGPSLSLAEEVPARATRAPVEEARLGAGEVIRYHPAERRLELRTDAGPISLAVDRNTVVFTARGVGTVRDLAPGLRVRAAWIGTPARAVWVELARTSPAAPEPAADAPPALPAPPPRTPGTTSGAPCDTLPCE